MLKGSEAAERQYRGAEVEVSRSVLPGTIAAGHVRLSDLLSAAIITIHPQNYSVAPSHPSTACSRDSCNVATRELNFKLCFI